VNSVPAALPVVSLVGVSAPHWLGNREYWQRDQRDQRENDSSPTATRRRSGDDVIVSISTPAD